MKKYNIAVIVAGIDEEYQNTILRGIHEFAGKNSVDIFHFIAFGGVMENKYHDLGEFNIFSLPDYRKFDGFILLTNTISNPPVTNDIIRKIKDAGVPAVSIDNDIPGFFHIGINNRDAMTQIVEHLILHHNYTKFNYISGPKNNPESNARLDAFLNALEEHDISINEDCIYYGDFRAKSGRDAIQYFTDKNLSMPDAFVCANDVMAISALSAVESIGYSIPADVAFSGFDNTYDARNYSPELTSVQRPLAESGRRACEIIVNAINGIPQERSTLLDMQARFTESCGCCDHMGDSIDKFKKRNYSIIESNAISMSLINRMSCQLIECDTLEEYVESLKTFVREINPEEFYLCLCDDWSNDFTESNRFNGVSKTFTTQGYTDSIVVTLAYSDGKFKSVPTFKSKEMLPGMFVGSDSAKSYYFVPLHYRERCLGYCVIQNCSFPLDSSMFLTWTITLCNTLENIRKIMTLDHAIKKLDRLYTIDTLSGILNRSGFNKNAVPLYDYCVRNKRSVMLMFIDMDGLKFINDNYGHKEGDKSIIAISDILTNCCDKGEVLCRFGGDEFIIFAADYDREKAEILNAEIQKNIDEYNSMSKNIFLVNASIGYHIAIPDENTNLFQLVTIADDIMYKNKEKRKSNYLKK